MGNKGGGEGHTVGFLDEGNSGRRRPLEVVQRRGEWRDVDEVANSEGNAPPGQKVGPDIFHAADVTADIVLAGQEDVPPEDLSFSRLVDVLVDGQWVEDKDEIVVICVQIEAVGTGGQPMYSAERSHYGVRFLLHCRLTYFYRVETTAVES